MTSIELVTDTLMLCAEADIDVQPTVYEKFFEACPAARDLMGHSDEHMRGRMLEQVFELLMAGRTDTEILDFMVTRYGDFVLYRPPLKPSTMLLWAGPFIIFGIGLIVLILFIRRRNQEPEVELSSEEHARAQSLLDNDK